MDVAKQYAERNRQGSEWFSHAGKNNSAQTPPDVPKLDVIQESVPLQAQLTICESPLPTVTSPVHVTPKVERKASPVLDATKPDINIATPSHQSVNVEQLTTPLSTPSKVESVVSPPGSTGRAQMVKPTCDSNQWYKGGPEGNGSSSKMRQQQNTGRKTRPVSQPVDWFTHDGTKNARPETKLRVTDEEGAAYCRRNKMGSSGTWFGHSGSGDTNTVTPRVTSQEGASNASRMRGESENWFNYNANAGGAREPLHVSKGRAAGRPQSNEMHSIFHHD